jgi:diguanylate cyclase (GGDEF)-like protein
MRLMVMAEDNDSDTAEERLARLLPSSAPSAEAQLRFLADHDPLTGLMNRRGFHCALQSALRQRSQRPAWLILLDLDEFKSINDLFGHRAGDQVLRQVATRLSLIAPAGAALARLGGDEFGLLITDCSSGLVDTLSRAVQTTIAERPFSYRNHHFSVQASLGLAAANSPISPEGWLDRADRVLAQAKQQSRALAGAGISEPRGARTAGGERFDPGDELCDAGGAIRRGALEIVAQPMHWIDRPEVKPDCELLVRLRTRDGRLLAPRWFLPFAHSRSLMPEIDRQVLGAALAWLAEPGAAEERPGMACLNLSRPGLYDGRLIADAVTALEGRPDLARRICFELRDGGLIAESASALRHLSMLRECGARLCLDGFGHTPLSLQGLRSLQPDLIKIDRSWLGTSATGEPPSAALGALIAIARDLGAVCAVVGVETTAQLQALREAGCDMVQGYRLGEPIDIGVRDCGLSSVLVHRCKDPQHHDPIIADPPG